MWHCKAMKNLKNYVYKSPRRIQIANKGNNFPDL